MKAIEFTSEIRNNSIVIPTHLKQEINEDSNKKLRVILLIDEKEMKENKLPCETEAGCFLRGYSDVDSIYDRHEKPA